MKKKSSKKLFLNKVTIAKLNSAEMGFAQGGTTTMVCIFSIQYCETIITITHTIVDSIERSCWNTCGCPTPPFSAEPECTRNKLCAPEA